MKLEELLLGDKKDIELALTILEWNEEEIEYFKKIIYLLNCRANINEFDSMQPLIYEYKHQYAYLNDNTESFRIININFIDKRKVFIRYDIFTKHMKSNNLYKICYILYKLYEGFYKFKDKPYFINFKYEDEVIYVSVKEHSEKETKEICQLLINSLIKDLKLDITLKTSNNDKCWFCIEDNKLTFYY